MMLVMALLRFTTNTISTPELVKLSLVRLFGAEVELFFTNAFGVGGKALLLVILTERSLLVRGLLGWLFTRFWPTRSNIPGWRWISGLLYGLIFGLLYNVAFTSLGLDSDVAISSYGSSLLPFGVPVWLNIFLLNVVFGLALVTLLPWHRAPAGIPEVSGGHLAGSMSRRDFSKLVAGGALAIVGGAPLWVGVKSALAGTS